MSDDLERDDDQPKRGRPTLPDEQKLKDPVSVRLPTWLHDRVCQESISTGKPVTFFLRQALADRYEKP